MAIFLCPVNNNSTWREYTILEYISYRIWRSQTLLIQVVNSTMTSFHKNQLVKNLSSRVTFTKFLHEPKTPRWKCHTPLMHNRECEDRCSRLFSKQSRSQGRRRKKKFYNAPSLLRNCACTHSTRVTLFFCCAFSSLSLNSPDDTWVDGFARVN